MIEEILANKIGKLEIELAQYKVLYLQIKEEYEKLKEKTDGNKDK